MITGLKVLLLIFLLWSTIVCLLRYWNKESDPFKAFLIVLIIILSLSLGSSYFEFHYGSRLNQLDLETEQIQHRLEKSENTYIPVTPKFNNEPASPYIKSEERQDLETLFSDQGFNEQQITQILNQMLFENRGDTTTESRGHLAD